MNPLYTRHFALAEFGNAEQDRLSKAKVLVVGLGGLGHLCATYLATAGVGHIVLNDFDKVDATNLQRQFLYNNSDIHRNKADVAKEKLAILNNNIIIESVNNRLNEDELIGLTKDFDLMLDCSDNFATRFTVNRVAVKNAIALVSGAAIRFEGQLTSFKTNNETPCYQCLFQESNEAADNCEGNGILAPVTGVIASSMAAEAIKILTQIGKPLMGQLQLYNAKDSSWRSVKYTKDPECEVCHF